MFAHAPLPRPLDAAEAFFWLLDRHSVMNFAVIAEGRGPLSESAIAAALPALQHRHPLLSAGIAGGAQQALHFYPDATPATVTVQTADADNWRTLLAKHIVTPFPLGSAPLFRVHLFVLPEQHWALAINFHHSIGDARSGYTVLRELFAVLDGQDIGGAIAPRPPLTALYPSHWAEPETRTAAEALRQIKREEDKQYGLPEALPGYREARSLDAPDFLSLHYDAQQLSALYEQARAHATTLHGILGAAELLAIRRQYPGEEERCLSLTSPADLRATLVPAMDVATPGFYVTLLRPSFRVGLHTDFWALARAVTEKTRHHFTRGDGHLLFHMMPPSALFPPTEEGLAAFSQAMERGPQSGLLSNAGRIARFATSAALHIDTLSFSLCPAPKQPFFASATTYEGRLAMNFMFDGDRLPHSLMHSIMNDMDACLKSLL